MSNQSCTFSIPSLGLENLSYNELTAKLGEVKISNKSLHRKFDVVVGAHGGIFSMNTYFKDGQAKSVKREYFYDFLTSRGKNLTEKSKPVMADFLRNCIFDLQNIANSIFQEDDISNFERINGFTIQQIKGILETNWAKDLANSGLIAPKSVESFLSQYESLPRSGVKDLYYDNKIFKSSLSGSKVSAPNEIQPHFQYQTPFLTYLQNPKNSSNTSHDFNGNFSRGVAAGLINAGDKVVLVPSHNKAYEADKSMKQKTLFDYWTVDENGKPKYYLGGLTDTGTGETNSDNPAYNKYISSINENSNIEEANEAFRKHNELILSLRKTNTQVDVGIISSIQYVPNEVFSDKIEKSDVKMSELDSGAISKLKFSLSSTGKTCIVQNGQEIPLFVVFNDGKAMTQEAFIAQQNYAKDLGEYLKGEDGLKNIESELLKDRDTLKSIVLSQSGKEKASTLRSIRFMDDALNEKDLNKKRALVYKLLVGGKNEFYNNHYENAFSTVLPSGNSYYNHIADCISFAKGSEPIGLHDTSIQSKFEVDRSFGDGNVTPAIANTVNGKPYIVLTNGEPSFQRHSTVNLSMFQQQTTRTLRSIKAVDMSGQNPPSNITPDNNSTSFDDILGDFDSNELYNIPFSISQRITRLMNGTNVSNYVEIYQAVINNSLSKGHTYEDAKAKLSSAPLDKIQNIQYQKSLEFIQKNYDEIVRIAESDYKKDGLLAFVKKFNVPKDLEKELEEGEEPSSLDTTENDEDFQEEDIDFNIDNEVTSEENTSKQNAEYDKKADSTDLFKTLPASVKFILMGINSHSRNMANPSMFLKQPTTLVLNKLLDLLAGKNLTLNEMIAFLETKHNSDLNLEPITKRLREISDPQLQNKLTMTLNGQKFKQATMISDSTKSGAESIDNKLVQNANLDAYKLFKDIFYNKPLLRLFPMSRLAVKSFYDDYHNAPNSEYKKEIANKFLLELQDALLKININTSLSSLQALLPINGQDSKVKGGILDKFVASVTNKGERGNEDHFINLMKILFGFNESAYSTDSKGQKRYNFGISRLIDNIISILNSPNPKTTDKPKPWTHPYKDKLRETSFFKYLTWGSAGIGDLAMRLSQFTGKIDTYNVKDNDDADVRKETKITEFNEMSNDERKKLVYNLYKNGSFFTHAHSDKDICLVLDNLPKSGNLRDVSFNIVKAETERIINAIVDYKLAKAEHELSGSKKEFVSPFDKNPDHNPFVYYFFPELNSDKNQFYHSLLAAEPAQLNELLANQTLIDSKIINIAKHIEVSYTKSYAEAFSIEEDEASSFAAFDLNNAFNYLMLVDSDPAFSWKSASKDDKMNNPDSVLKAIQSGSIFESLNKTFDGKFKRSAKMVSPYQPLINNQGNNEYKSISITSNDKKLGVSTDIGEYSYLLENEGGGDAYKKMDISDGEELLSVDEVFYAQNVLGNIPSDIALSIENKIKMFNLNVKIWRDKQLKLKVESGMDIEIYNLHEKSFPSDYGFTPDEVRALTVNKQKPLSTFKGFVTNPQSGTSVKTMFVKSGAVGLFPNLTRNNPQLEATRRFMLINGISRAAFSSGIKEGGPTTIDIDDIVNGVELKEESIVLQNRVFSGEQLKVPFDSNKKVISMGTQSLKQLFNGLANTKLFNRVNKQLHESASNLLKSSLEKSTYNDLSIDSIKEILSGLDHMTVQDLERVQNSKYLFLEPSLFKSLDKVLINGLKSALSLKIQGRKYPIMSNIGFENHLDSVSKSKTHYSPKYDSKKGLRSMRINIVNGENHKSIDGMDYKKEVMDLLKDYKYKPVELEKLLEEFEAKHDIKVEISPAQMFITWNFKDSEGKNIPMSDFMVDGKLDWSLIPEEMLQMFAFRTPSQGSNSRSFMEVVGFLPKNYADTMIAPKEFLAQMGSDFDIDSLTAYHTRFKKVVNKETKEISWIKPSKGEEGYDQNKFIEAHLEVAKNPMALIGTIKPLDDLGFVDMIKSVLKERGQDTLRTGSRYTAMNQIYNYKTGTAGKNAVAMLSRLSTLSCWLENNKISIRNPFKLTYQGESIEFNDLSSSNTLFGTLNARLDIISAIQSLGVDNIKDLMIESFNWNDHTHSTFSGLALLGFPKEIITKIMMHPELIEYSKKKESGYDRSLGYFLRDKMNFKGSTNEFFADLSKGVSSVDVAIEPEITKDLCFILMAAERVGDESSKFADFLSLGNNQLQSTFEINAKLERIEKTFSNKEGFLSNNLKLSDDNFYNNTYKLWKKTYTDLIESELIPEAFRSAFMKGKNSRIVMNLVGSVNATAITKVMNEFEGLNTEEVRSSGIKERGYAKLKMELTNTLAEDWKEYYKDGSNQHLRGILNFVNKDNKFTINVLFKNTTKNIAEIFESDIIDMLNSPNESTRLLAMRTIAWSNLNSNTSGEANLSRYISSKIENSIGFTAEKNSTDLAKLAGNLDILESKQVDTNKSATENAIALFKDLGITNEPKNVASNLQNDFTFFDNVLNLLEKGTNKGDERLSKLLRFYCQNMNGLFYGDNRLEVVIGEKNSYKPAEAGKPALITLHNALFVSPEFKDRVGEIIMEEITHHVVNNLVKLKDEPSIKPVYDNILSMIKQFEANKSGTGGDLILSTRIGGQNMPETEKVQEFMAAVLTSSTVQASAAKLAVTGSFGSRIKSFKDVLNAVYNYMSKVKLFITKLTSKDPDYINNTDLLTMYGMNDKVKKPDAAESDPSLINLSFEAFATMVNIVSVVNNRGQYAVYASANLLSDKLAELRKSGVPIEDIVGYAKKYNEIISKFELDCK
jgi:hypothetical protein